MDWTKLKESKLLRLEQIGESLRKTGKARALIGFGSMAEQERVDAYSDLDFLVIPKKGFKTELIENLDWLTSISPVGYYYQFTADGYKLFYRDGIFCDFGILEACLLPDIFKTFALDKLLACSRIFTSEEACFKDPFQNERRYEQRFPIFAASLTRMIQGYERCPESALEIISFLEEHTPINPFMKKMITGIAEDLIAKRSSFNVE
ncbi:hypothetical protein [Paenibacillus sp. Root444D2]|uniref:hypothetical protein n=1 Tax=Paenibacillus sp. Root444D2 TaxID=1736538 RepID=UPI00070B3805|nr:hypothetical protein [Paenibacillus sp. Root444D2]KQX66987.1 hypothetical protein ASD40_27960 [Paenibacillus sp. Root444D2]